MPPVPEAEELLRPLRIQVRLPKRLLPCLAEGQLEERREGLLRPTLRLLLLLPWLLPWLRWPWHP